MARLTSVSAASRRYAALPRTSSIGLSTCKSCGSARADKPLAACRPSSFCSKVCRRCATSEQEPTAIPVWRITPSASVSINTETMAIEITR